MNKKIFISLLILFFLGQVLLEAKNSKKSNSDSVYDSSFSSISQKDCQILESDNLGSIEECESFAGMKVVVIEGDTKQGIVLTRDNKRYELDFGSLVTQGFITLHSDLEWVYRREEFDNPIAMILRLEVDDDSDDTHEKVIPYSLVSKITEKDICIVAKVETDDSKDKLVRDIAQKANSMPCISIGIKK